MKGGCEHIRVIMNNTVEIITLSDGTRIAKITSIQFKGKRGIEKITKKKSIEKMLKKAGTVMYLVLHYRCSPTTGSWNDTTVSPLNY